MLKFVRSFEAQECLSRKCLPIGEEEFLGFQHIGADGSMWNRHNLRHTGHICLQIWMWPVQCISHYFLFKSNKNKKIPMAQNCHRPACSAKLRNGHHNVHCELDGRSPSHWSCTWCFYVHGFSYYCCVEICTTYPWLGFLWLKLLNLWYMPL